MTKRLEQYLIEKGFAKDKKEAFVLTTSGRVFINGQKAISPAQLIKPNSKITIRQPCLYVGRGAIKLQYALDKFRIEVQNKACADIGAATGGFTQILLLNGAKKVYAIDTAYGKLDLALRQDKRVIVMEKTDIRDIKSLPELADIAVTDISLIPLIQILQSVKRIINRKGDIIALFKPQYETRDKRVLKKGVVQENAEREKLLNNFLFEARKNKWQIIDWTKSPIAGSKGNVEYLIWVKPNFDS